MLAPCASAVRLRAASVHPSVTTRYTSSLHDLVPVVHLTLVDIVAVEQRQSGEAA